MSEDKVRRKDWCWSMRTVYVLGKLSDVSGPSLKEAGRCNFFSGSPSLKNSKVKHAWPRAMGDRLGSSSRGRMSEDKVRRKDWCWSVRAVYVVGKLPDVSGPRAVYVVGKLPDVSGPSLGEVGRYKFPLQEWACKN